MTDLSDLSQFNLSGAAQALLGSGGATLASYASGISKAVGSVASAMQAGNAEAVMNASVAIVAAVAPEIAPFWAATTQVLEALPQAHGAGDPCAGQYKTGAPGPDEMAHMWSSTGPLNPGDSRQAAPGSFAAWWAQQVLNAPDDSMGFFRALAGAQALEEGKFNNCYSDATGGATLLLGFLASWNAAHTGAPLTITRQIPNAPASSPRPGGGFAVETPDVPPDNDAWTNVLATLYSAANHGYQAPAGTSPRAVASIKVNQPMPSHVVRLKPMPGAVTTQAPGTHVVTLKSLKKGTSPVPEALAAGTHTVPAGVQAPEIAEVYPYVFDGHSWTATSSDWGDLGLIYAAIQAHPGAYVGHYAWDGQSMQWKWDAGPGVNS